MASGVSRITTVLVRSSTSEIAPWSGLPTQCGDPTVHTCYPPTVNYSPTYYLINGRAFDKTNPSASLYSIPSTVKSGNLLVRLVNAGLRMHVPSIVGATTAGSTKATPGMTLIAEDGNPVPGAPRVQSEVFMAASKTYDVMINVPPACTPPANGTCTTPALPIYDRQLSLSANTTARDAGMLAYIGANAAAAPATAASTTPAKAVNDSYNGLLLGQTLTISDPSQGVIANDINVIGVAVSSGNGPTHGTLTLNSNGTFTYKPSDPSSVTPDSFKYCANGSTTICATVSLGASTVANATITCTAQAFASTVAGQLSIKPPGVLAGCTNSAGLALTVAGATSTTPKTFGIATVDVNGGFNITAGGIGTQTFSVPVQDSVGTTGSVSVTVTFPTASGLMVSVLDGADHTTPIKDYRWIIEEDRTFYVDPLCTTNPLPAGCPVAIQSGPAAGSPVNYGTNFHTSFMPLVAAGCTGPLSCESGQTVQASSVVCDAGNGICHSGSMQTPLDPSQVYLDPTKRYYISILPGDAANPFIGGYAGAPTNCVAGALDSTDPTGLNTSCGHGMGGAPIPAAAKAVTVLTVPTPFPTATLSVFVYEDDWPLNGEQGAGGGVDVLATNEPGLGGFQVTIFDQAGGTGDATGQPTYDMFNQPLSNSLAGTIDPITGLDACPISNRVTASGGAQNGIVGMIITCPKFESDGKTLSPMAGQAIVKNLYPGRYGVSALPGADRIGLGEEWVQTNTLDGQKAHDSFMRVGEPGYFQEFGPAGYHVSIGFANPKIINDRRTNSSHTGMCDSGASGGSLPCTWEVKGSVFGSRLSRTPDQRLYSSGSRDALSFTQCYVSLGDPDGAEIAFQKCDANGGFDFKGIPAGNWKITTFDQWNDQIIDGITQGVGVGCAATANSTGACPTGSGTNTCNGKATTGNVCDMGEIGVHQWQADLYTRTFIDTDGSGVSNDSKPGLAFVATNIRFRDGSYSNFNSTDLSGNAGFNEVFPLFNWYVMETDSTRYKTTGVHVIYDAGGPADGSASCDPVKSPCGYYPSDITPTFSPPSAFLANTYENFPLPAALMPPGSVPCAKADCLSNSIATDGFGQKTFAQVPNSTGRIDPPYWFGSYGWQGYIGQGNFLEFGEKPFAEGETGPIHGHVIYASTRPFDDPQLLLQLSWEPMIPHVRVNLYQEGVASDGVTPTLTLVDYTETSSFDDWAQGFRKDAAGNLVQTTDPVDNSVGAIPNISCPGQTANAGGTIFDPFYYAMQDQPSYLDLYGKQHATPGAFNANATGTPIAYHSQYKCYDGMHSWNQLQPAPYDGMYSFPSATGIDPKTGRPLGTHCKVCLTNPDSTDPYRYGGSATPGPFTTKSPGTPMLPPGKYVVEVVVPPGYELVKEEDKNILIGDNYIAPAVVQFPGLGGAVYILPDQAEIGAQYNATNAQNSTQSQGRNSSLVSHEGDTGSDESFWPCVGTVRQVPDFISLFPQSGEVAPFAGAKRPLCDRKEVNLTEQSSALVKFYLFTSTHVAAHFQGIILDDFTAEFDPFSPQFGEKFAPSYLPVGVKDWTGNAVNRVYSDQFGLYNGLNYSTWEVNPPNPTGYGPTMMVYCMNDAGTTNGKNGLSTPDPLFQPGYSQFCYELPSMPGQTGYFDTPVVPVQAFSEGYNHPDCALPDATPAVASVVNSDATQPQGPWVTSGNAATKATASFTVSGVALCTTRSCSNPSTIKFLLGSVKCTANGVNGPNCSSNNAGIRASSVASYINSRINALLGANYASTVNNATVTVTAPNTGSGSNGTSLVLASNVASPTTSLALAGGLDAQAASLALTINALGNQSVEWYGYTGPSITTAPYNQPKIARHYGFGAGPSTPALNCALGQPCVALLGSDGNKYPLTGVAWTDGQITGTVATTANGHTLPNCAVSQQSLYGGSTTQCGQLVITTAAGKTSVDTVTVTVGGKKPTVLAAGNSIQSAIDAAMPGDMIIVPAGTYNEMVVMWKPVRLQGVGAASAVIDANTQPAGKLLTPWRTKMVCLFGLTPDGRPRSATDTACDAGMNYALVGDTANNFQTMTVDRLPFEATLGWDSTLNGNLAEQLSEPSLLGAYEGAAITVLGKGVKFLGGASLSDAFGATTGAAFPANTVLLTAADCGGNNASSNPYPTNYLCNPSSIDGLGIRDSSQGGGGIFVHGYAHNLQIANNRVSNNTGTMSGGITIGVGEHPDVQLAGAAAVLSYPQSCETSRVTNLGLPFCFNLRTNTHHNVVVGNSSMGDELFSSTPAGAGGVSINTGADYYKFQNNWVCGNISTGDGGGFAHIGFIKNGDIEHNTIIFNQSTNPTITTNGGGLLVMGAPDADPTTCGVTTDQDCLPPPGTVTPSDGSGPGLIVNANLILGNAADSGSGGGVRLQGVNGTDVLGFLNGASACTADLGAGNGNNSHCYWNSVNLTNNIIVNNVAGWDGAGVSMLDALAVNLVNNTIAANDSTASSGTLFQTLFSPLASSTSPTTHVTCGATAGQSCPQVSGVVSQENSPVLVANINQAVGTKSCAQGHGVARADCFGSTGATAIPGHSIPLMLNDAIWQNRSFYIGVGTGFGPATAGQNQQHLVSLYNAAAQTGTQQATITGTGTAAGNQTTTGACPTGSSFWEIGYRGDAQAGSHATSGFQPVNSLLSANVYGGSNNQTSTTKVFTSQYCNGSRTPPEAGGAGWAVPPGTNEGNASPQPEFTLAPSAVVDEGNNWVNLRWGPLSLYGVTNTAPYTATTPLADYTPTGAAAINKGAAAVTVGTGNGASTVAAPSTDYFGNARPQGGGFEIGAIEVSGSGTGGGGGCSVTVLPSTLTFGTVPDGLSSAPQTVTLTNSCTSRVQNGTYSFGNGSRFARVGGFGNPGTCGNSGNISLNAAASCTINVVFQPTSGQSGAINGNLTIGGFTGTTITGSPVALTGTAQTAAGTLTFSSATNGSLGTVLGVRTLTFTITNPRAPVTSVVTITNTGAGALAITAESLMMNFGSLYSITGTSCSFTSPLAFNASCTVSIRYATPATRPPVPDIGAAAIANNGSNANAGNTALALVAQ
jgi:hypothetical protein